VKARYLPGIRLLAECYQRFEQFSSDHVRTLGLTPCQFDIIATLGNTPGMSFKELGEKTLITKGALTGIVDRLEDKGMVRRVTQVEDRRSTIVKLTPRGEREFERIFQPHLRHCTQAFTDYGESDYVALEKELAKLKRHLDAALAAIKPED